jgi:putative spermidine/putrescine transport system permease protein
VERVRGRLRRLFTSAAAPYWQVAPLAGVFAVFFVLPLAVTVAVSFWRYTEYSMSPALVTDNYAAVFAGCWRELPSLCLTFKTYLSTLKFCVLVWLATLLVGFTVAYFLAFHVRSLTWQIVLFLVCTIPFWTSNVIRMISWVPLLGRNGLVNAALQSSGLTHAPLEWLLFSDFTVVLAFVHLYTMFKNVPFFNSISRIEPAIIEAARDAGASGWQTLWNIVVPLSKPGLVIGSIFVATLVMGDYVTIGVMGGQQIASVGKIIQVQLSYLQFPLAAANAVVLLGAVLGIIGVMTRVVDVRAEL